MDRRAPLRVLVPREQPPPPPPELSEVRAAPPDGVDAGDAAALLALLPTAALIAVAELLGIALAVAARVGSV